MRVDRAVGLPRRHAADDVADGEARHTLSLRLTQRSQGVGGFARLGDDDGQFVLLDDGVPVAILGAVVDLDRNARQRLDQELADETGMPGRSARDDGDLPESSERRPRRG